MIFEAGVILAGLVLLVVILLVTRLVMGPFKNISRLILNCGIALCALLLLNYVGSFVGFHLPINPITVTGVSILGLPGLLLLSAMSFLLL